MTIIYGSVIKIKIVETRKDHSDTDERVDDSEDDTNVFENVKKFFAPRGQWNCIFLFDNFIGGKYIIVKIILRIIGNIFTIRTVWKRQLVLLLMQWNKNFWVTFLDIN